MPSRRIFMPPTVCSLTWLNWVGLPWLFFFWLYSDDSVIHCIFLNDQAWLSKMSSVFSSLLLMFTASFTQLVPQKTGLNINKRFMVQWHLCSGHLKMSISYQKILTNSLVSFIVKNNEKLNLYFVKIRIYHSISFSIG